MANEGNYVQVRRGLLEHTETGRLSPDEFCAFVMIVLAADKANGVWQGCDKALDAKFGFKFGEEKAEKILTSLGEKHKQYIRSFRVHGQRGNQPYIIDKYLVSYGAAVGKRVNAWATTDWRNPVYYTGAEDEAEAVAELAVELKAEAVAYSKPRDLETSKPQIGGGEPQAASLSGGPSAPSNGDVTTLVQTVFVLLGEPEALRTSLLKRDGVAKKWGKQAQEALSHSALKPLVDALKASYKAGDFWSDRITTAAWPMAMISKNVDQIIAAAAAALRPKKVFLVKTAKQTRPKYQYQQEKEGEDDFYEEHNPSWKPDMGQS